MVGLACQPFFPGEAVPLRDGWEAFAFAGVTFFGFRVFLPPLRSLFAMMIPMLTSGKCTVALRLRDCIGEVRVAKRLIMISVRRNARDTVLLHQSGRFDFGV